MFNHSEQACSWINKMINFGGTISATLSSLPKQWIQMESFVFIVINIYCRIICVFRLCRQGAWMQCSYMVLTFIFKLLELLEVKQFFGSQNIQMCLNIVLQQMLQVLFQAGTHPQQENSQVVTGTGGNYSIAAKQDKIYFMCFVSCCVEDLLQNTKQDRKDHWICSWHFLKADICAVTEEDGGGLTSDIKLPLIPAAATYLLLHLQHLSPGLEAWPFPHITCSFALMWKQGCHFQFCTGSAAAHVVSHQRPALLHESWLRSKETFGTGVWLRAGVSFSLFEKNILEAQQLLGSFGPLWRTGDHVAPNRTRGLDVWPHGQKKRKMFWVEKLQCRLLFWREGGAVALLKCVCDGKVKSLRSISIYISEDYMLHF